MFSSDLSMYRAESVCMFSNGLSMYRADYVCMFSTDLSMNDVRKGRVRFKYQG